MALYKLSATLSGHTQDVRGLCSDSKGATILSSSRDSTAKAWIRASNHKTHESSSTSTSSWINSATFAGHENYVGAVVSTFIASPPEAGDGGSIEVLVTGSSDATIQVWDIQQSSGIVRRSLKTLIGHASNVCCLHATSDGLLASGSWDTTAQIWDLNDPSGNPLHILTGSDLSIWAVLILPGSTRSKIFTLTASADKLIRLYENDKVIRTFKGHSQPVRALTLLQDNQVNTGNNDETIFASASNDGSIRIWSLQTGECLKVLAGHDSFVYSLASTPEGDLVSSGEDRTVRIWDRSSGELRQIITIPAISIWAVTVLAGTSDIVAGSSDCLIRVFSTDTTRQASAEDLKAYEDLLSASSINTSQIGDVKKSDLPSEEVLKSKQGKKEGEVLMAKNSLTGNVEAYQWSSANNEWISIGTVVDAVGSGRKQLFEGKEYDHVFDVDVSEGMPPLKLPYNITQNPYEAAQQFLVKNNLPASYVDQVVQFIEKNTGGATLGGQGALDPYTGSSSYRTIGNNAPAPSQNGTQSSFSGDPWSRSSAAPQASSSILPHKTPLTFPQSNVAAAQKKLFDFNRQLSEQPTTATEFPLDNADISTLQASLSSLTTSPTSFSLDNATVTILEKLLEWPFSFRFPVLDVIRIIALSAPAPITSTGIFFTLLSHVSPNSTASVKENETNSMLALRAIANTFAKAEGRKGLVDNAAEALETLSVVGVPEGLNKNGKSALATVALNYSILVTEASLPELAVAHLVDFITSLLAEDDTETLYRSLVALGNVLSGPPAVRSALQAETMQVLKSRAQTVAKRTSEDRIKNVVAEIISRM